MYSGPWPNMQQTMFDFGKKLCLRNNRTHARLPIRYTRIGCTKMLRFSVESHRHWHIHQHMLLAYEYIQKAHFASSILPTVWRNVLQFIFITVMPYSILLWFHFSLESILIRILLFTSHTLRFICPVIHMMDIGENTLLPDQIQKRKLSETYSSGHTYQHTHTPTLTLAMYICV